MLAPQPRPCRVPDARRADHHAAASELQHHRQPARIAGGRRAAAALHLVVVVTADRLFPTHTPSRPRRPGAARSDTPRLPQDLLMDIPSRPSPLLPSATKRPTRVRVRAGLGRPARAPAARAYTPAFARESGVRTRAPVARADRPTRPPSPIRAGSRMRAGRDTAGSRRLAARVMGSVTESWGAATPARELAALVCALTGAVGVSEYVAIGSRQWRRLDVSRVAMGSS